MITIPILKEFNQEKQIGTLTIDESKLPIIPNYTFSLDYRITSSELNENNEVEVTGYKLISVSIVDDDNFSKYLDSNPKNYNINYTL
jgi:hypothetical protein